MSIITNEFIREYLASVQATIRADDEHHCRVNCRCTLHPKVKTVAGRTAVGEDTIVDDPPDDVPLIEGPE